jgi:hypothetical protein
MGGRNTFRAKQQTNLGTAGLRARLLGSQRNCGIPLQGHGFLGAPVRALYSLERSRYWHSMAAARQRSHAVRQRRTRQIVSTGGVFYLTKRVFTPCPKSNSKHAIRVSFN